MLVNDYLTRTVDELYPTYDAFSHLGDRQLYENFINEYWGCHIRYTNELAFEKRFLRIVADFYPQLKEKLRVNEIAIESDLKSFEKTGQSITNVSSNPTTMNNPALDMPVNFVENQTSSNSTKTFNQTLDDKMRSMRQGLWTQFLMNFDHLFIQNPAPQDAGIYRSKQ